MTAPAPQAIEAAAGAILRVTWESDGTPFQDEPENVQNAMREFASAALTAAAPMIAAQAKAEALREAAAAAEGMHDPIAPECQNWADWLRARADHVEFMAKAAADPEGQRLADAAAALAG